MNMNMNEKEYWVTDGEQGAIRISEDVIASIASISTGEVDGVSHLSSGFTSELASKLTKKPLAKGVKIALGTNDTVSLEVSFAASYGYAVSEVAKNVQQSVKNTVESMTGLTVTAVNACVTSIALEAPVEAPAAPVEAVVADPAPVVVEAVLVEE